MGLLRTIFGAVFGVLCLVVLMPALAAINSEGSGVMPALAWALVGVMAFIGWAAPTVRRTFGRGFLALGVCFLFLPFSALLLSGRTAHEVVTASADQASAVIGAGLAGAVVTGAATFIGLIMGAIFVILGLVLALGGRREVIVVNR